MKSIKLIFVFLSVFTINLSGQSIIEGKKALENNQLKKAGEIFYNMLINNQAIAETYYYLGNVYMVREQPDSAKVFYIKGISLFPQNPFNYIGLGKVLLSSNTQEAKINFDKAISLAPVKNSTFHVLAADAYINATNKNIPVANDYLNRAISIDPRNPEIYISLGDAFLADNVGGMAITNYEKAIEINPKNAKAHARIGVVYTQSRFFDGSEKAFTEAITADPDYSPAYRDQAELYWTFRKYEKARDSYQIYLQKSDSTIATLTKYAYILFMSKDYGTQINIINTLMAMDSTNIVLSRLQGYSLYEQKKYADGLMFMESFFKKSDKSKIIPQDYEYYGKLLGKAPRDTINKINRDSLAIINLQKAMELDSGKTELLTDMGDVYMRSKNYLMAQQTYQKKINSNKNPSAIDYFSLGKSFYFNKEYGKSDTAFMKVVEIKPTASAGYLWRARSNSYNEEASKDTTFSLYSKYLEIAVPDSKSPKNELAEGFRYLGFYYVQKDDNLKAIENFTKSLEFDAENKDAKDALNQLGQQK